MRNNSVSLRVVEHDGRESYFEATNVWSVDVLLRDVVARAVGAYDVELDVAVLDSVVDDGPVRIDGETKDERAARWQRERDATLVTGERVTLNPDGTAEVKVVVNGVLYNYVEQDVFRSSDLWVSVDAIDTPALNDVLREAGLEYPLGLAGVRDLVRQRDAYLEEVQELRAVVDRYMAAENKQAVRPVRDEDVIRLDEEPEKSEKPELLDTVVDRVTAAYDKAREIYRHEDAVVAASFTTGESVETVRECVGPEDE